MPLRDLAGDGAACLDRGAVPIRAGKEDLSVRVEVLWAFSE